MTQTTPSFLRIHRGPAKNNPATNSGDGENLAPLETNNETSDHVASFWNSFESTTGWRLAPRSRRVGGAPILVSAVDAQAIDGAMDGSVAGDLFGGEMTGEFDSFEESFIDSLTQISAVGKSAATQLASSATDLIAELLQTQTAMRRQQAELAARAAVIARPESQTGLANLIASILTDASEGCGCQGAAFYTLDDDTSVLATRAVHGIPESRLNEEARSLQGSRGDLEAMVKGVVTIDDLNFGPLDTWNAPESAAAGICAVVNAGDVPIGTLWFFAEETQRFGPAHAAVARLAAQAIGTALTHAADDVWGDSPPAESATCKNEIRDVAQWQMQSLPIGARLADDWKADGMIESSRDFATGWHLWDVLPDGSLVLAIAEAVEADITGAMNATVARAAFTAHAGYRHTPSQMLARIGDTLWQTSLGDQLMSMLYVRVDPETGEGEIASAGHITAMIGSRYGYRPVVSGQSDPLCSHIDTQCVHETFRMMPGETLLGYTPGMVSDKCTHTTIGGLLHTSMKQATANPLASIRRALTAIPTLQERGAATLVRSAEAGR